MSPKKVLLIASDAGFHWDELCDVYHAFDDAHFQIDLASPFGHPSADPRSLRVQLFFHLLGSATTASRLPSTAWWGRPVAEAVMRAKRLDHVNARDYDAAYVTGGTRGTPLDLDANPDLGYLLRDMLDSHGMVGGRRAVIASFGRRFGLEEGTWRGYSLRFPIFARRVAWRMIENLVGPEDLHGRLRSRQKSRSHLPEFLDRKDGRPPEPGPF